MEKLKKIFSPGHEKDENIMYNDPNTTSASATRESAPSTQHGIEHPTNSSTKQTDLRHNVLDPQSDINTRPNPTSHISSASTIPDDVSTASIRSGVIGAGQEPRNVEGTGFTDYATTGGLAAAPQQKLPVRSATPVGQARPRPSQMETMDPKGFATSSHAHKGLGHNYNGDPCPEGDEPYVPGYPHHQNGPHSTDIANKLDPHVPGEFPSDDGFETHERRRDGGLMDATEPTGSHHGRDAALGAGAGAAGVGAYEALKHRDHTSESDVTGQRSQPGAYDNTGSAVDSHSTTERSFPLTSHPATTASSSSNQPTSRDHHLGRDAALVGGGLGAAGLGAHEAGSHRPSHEIEGYEDQRFDPSAASGDKPTRIPNLMYGSSNKATHPGQSDSTNYGRDATLAGGVGAGAVGSQLQGYNHGGRTETDPASKTIGPHKSNLMNIVDPRVQPEPEKMKDRTTAGPHQSDMMNRADPRVDSDLSKQNNEHHYGRDAALVGGAGAAGAGAYEYAQHRGGPSESIGTSNFDPRSTNTTNVVDPNHDPILEHQRLERQHALEAAMAGGAGTAGVGAYEHGGQSTLETSPFDPHPTASTNVANGRNEPALAQQNQGHHYGRDAALAGGAGVAGAGAYEQGRHHGGPTDTALGTSTFDPRSTNTTNVVDPSTDPTLAQQQQGHHYGRDAAVVGGVGAAGAGAYEYGQHHGNATDNGLGTSTFDPRSTNTANVVDPNHDPLLAEQRQERKHLYREAVAAGGAGAAGYGAYEALDPKEQEKLAKQQAHEAEKAQKAQQHHMDKDLKHQQKEREHALEKEEKKHKHDLEKAEKQREREADKSEKEAELATKENEHPEKKHHGLLGFLHRDKKNEPEEDLRHQGRLQEADIVAHQRHQRELEAAAAGGSVPAAGARFEPSLEEQRENPLASSPQYTGIEEKGHQTVSTDTSGRHRLHKDPPASVLRERGLDSDEQSYGSGSRGI